MIGTAPPSSGQASDALPDPPDPPGRGVIVVGFASMTSSQTAVRWAAVEAERRMSELRIVHAYALPDLGQPVQHDVDDLLRAEASTLLDRIADGTRRDHPRLEITTRLIHGAPVNALRAESVGADLTVVGAKESSRLARAILGSVASAIAAVNPAPVAVVHPDHPVNAGGPIVVGVDGSPDDSAVINFAFAEAVARNTAVSAVHAWNASVLTGGVPDYPAALAQTETEHKATAMLAESLAGWGATYPDVMLVQAVRRGGAAEVLLECSTSAAMVVVGRRPRGELAAMVMGSTSRSLTAHSHCPVVIVPSGHDRHG